MVSGATVPDNIADGEMLSIDAERGVVFEGNVLRTPRR